MNLYRPRRREWLVSACATLPLLARADLVDTVTRLRPSVVAVGTYRPTESPRFGFRGTGFVVGNGRLVVTNHHVLPNLDGEAERVAAQSLMVLVPGSGAGAEPELRAATLLTSDRTHDLALLRIEGDALAPATLAGPELAPEGSAVALMGFPIGGLFGYAPVVHRGIVAAHTRIALPAPSAKELNAAALTKLRAGAFEIYQLDATAYPGNSGGPLVNADTGVVIGVVNMVLVRGTRESALSNPTGITYAIPVRRVHELLKP